MDHQWTIKTHIFYVYTRQCRHFSLFPFFFFFFFLAPKICTLFLYINKCAHFLCKQINMHTFFFIYISTCTFSQRANMQTFSLFANIHTFSLHANIYTFFLTNQYFIVYFIYFLSTPISTLLSDNMHFFFTHKLAPISFTRPNALLFPTYQ